MVFQHFELFPHLSIIDNLTLAQVKVLNRDKASSRKKGSSCWSAWAWRRMRKIPGAALRRPAAARGHCPRPVYGPDRHAV
jgi:glutamate/aspartate transport system ATP-binding protein